MAEFVINYDWNILPAPFLFEEEGIPERMIKGEPYQGSLINTIQHVVQGIGGKLVEINAEKVFFDPRFSIIFPVNEEEVHLPFSSLRKAIDHIRNYFSGHLLYIWKSFVEKWGKVNELWIDRCGELYVIGENNKFDFQGINVNCYIVPSENEVRVIDFDEKKQLSFNLQSVPSKYSPLIDYFHQHQDVGNIAKFQLLTEMNSVYVKIRAMGESL